MNSLIYKFFPYIQQSSYRFSCIPYISNLLSLENSWKRILALIPDDF